MKLSMKKLQSRKLCAALVIIAWLATLVALWGMLDAGRRAVTPLKSCTPKDLRGLGLQLEMAPSAEAALNLLNGDAAKAPCLRSGMAAQIRADNLFIPAYSGLTLTLFLFVCALRIPPSGKRRSLGRGLLALGLLLALAMSAGDVVENLRLHSMIELAKSGQPLPDAAFEGLIWAGRLKWGALAVSALALALAWTSRSFVRLAWVLRVLGLTAAALFIAGMALPRWQVVNWGMAVLGAFWLAALIHAIAVAVENVSIRMRRS
jgi:hypothetical protein